jgi:hypothetical protein
MAPRTHNKITTAVSLRRREAAARRAQDAVGPGGEVARLQAHVAELLVAIRQRDLTIEGLRRRLEEHEEESED